MLKAPTFGLLMACAAVLIAVAPVTAATGTVGYYSVTDTASSPGATGKYGYVQVAGPDAENHWELHRIVVRPPGMKAVAGKSNQAVGWSFTVQRVDCFEPPCYWNTTYTSAVYAAATSDSAYAPFVKESVGVRLPPYAELSHYRVKIKMFWYYRSGGIQGTASALIHYYKRVAYGMDARVDEYSADAEVYNWDQ